MGMLNLYKEQGENLNKDNKQALLFVKEFSILVCQNIW